MTHRPRKDQCRPTCLPARYLARLLVAFLLAAFCISLGQNPVLAQSKLPPSPPAPSIYSLESASSHNRVTPLKTRYLPPVHQIPVARSGLKSDVGAAAAGASSDRSTTFVVPQYPSESLQTNPSSGWTTRRQLLKPVPDPAAVPFQPAPLVGPELPEPSYSGEFSLDAPRDIVPEQIAPGQLDPTTVSPQSQASGAEVPGRRPMSARPKALIPPDYWVISTRHCPQADSPSEADSCTEYFYRGPQGKLESRTAEDFYQSLDPAVPVCFMIHGSLTAWEQSLLEGHATYEWLKRAAPNTKFQLVLFTWPSERSLTLIPQIDFSVLGHQSSFNGLYLARVLSRMPPSTSVSLIGHSHGARLTVSALHVLGGGSSEGYRLAPRQQRLPRIRTALAAAALDHQWLDPNQRYGHALQATESLVNLRNQTDLALMLYPFPMLLGYDSLGRAGFNWYDRYQLGPQYGKVRNVEVTWLLGVRHIWPRFQDHPEIAQMLAPYVFFEQDVATQTTVMRQRGPGWWRLTSPEDSTPAIAQPTPRSASGGRSTLVRSALPMQNGQRIPETAEISLEPYRAVVNPPAARSLPDPRTSRRRNP